MLYLEKLVDRISKFTKESLSEMFESDKQTILPQPHERDLYHEVVQHVTFCQSRSATAYSVINEQMKSQ